MNFFLNHHNGIQTLPTSTTILPADEHHFCSFFAVVGRKTPQNTHFPRNCVSSRSRMEPLRGRSELIGICQNRPKPCREVEWDFSSVAKNTWPIRIARENHPKHPKKFYGTSKESRRACCCIPKNANFTFCSYPGVAHSQK